MKTLCAFLVVGLMLAGPVMAETFVLTEKTGAGYTTANVEDNMFEWSAANGFPYNYGGDKRLDIGHGSPAGDNQSHYDVSAYLFDLTAIPTAPPIAGVSQVNSATLRVYQLSGTTNDKYAQQILESWVEGTSDGDYWDHHDGSDTFARNAGNFVNEDALLSTTHSTATNPNTTIYYIEDVTALALDPNDGTGHYVSREDNAANFFRQWDINGRRLATATSLDDLVDSYGATSDAYYYDDAADRVYVRRGTHGINYWEDSDLWTDSVWDGTRTKGPSGVSVEAAAVVNDQGSEPATGWWEWDVTDMATDWLVNGEENCGVRLSIWGNYHGSAVLISTEETLLYDPLNGVFEGDPAYVEANGIDVRPELLLDVEFKYLVPEPAGLGLMGLALLGLRRRRS